MKICPNCNIEYNDDVSFCGHCGSPLVQKIENPFCPYCGKQLDNEYSFCPYCGKSITSIAEISTQQQIKVNKVYGVIKQSNQQQENNTYIPIPKKQINNSETHVQNKRLSGGKLVLTIILILVGLVASLIPSSPIKIACRGYYGHSPEGFTSSIMAAILVPLIIAIVCCFLVEKLHERWGKYLFAAMLTVTSSNSFHYLFAMPGTVIALILSYYIYHKTKKSGMEGTDYNTKSTNNNSDSTIKTDDDTEDGGYTESQKGCFRWIGFVIIIIILLILSTSFDFSAPIFK